MTNHEIAQQERLRDLPRPTNLQAKKMLRKAINRLALVNRSTASVAHSCIFCAKEIGPAMTYRNGGPMLKAHQDCFEEMARRLA